MQKITRPTHSLLRDELVAARHLSERSTTQVCARPPNRHWPSPPQVQVSRAPLRRLQNHTKRCAHRARRTSNERPVRRRDERAPRSDKLRPEQTSAVAAIAARWPPRQRFSASTAGAPRNHRNLELVVQRVRAHEQANGSRRRLVLPSDRLRGVRPLTDLRRRTRDRLTADQVSPHCVGQTSRQDGAIETIVSTRRLASNRAQSIGQTSLTQRF